MRRLISQFSRPIFTEGITAVTASTRRRGMIDAGGSDPRDKPSGFKSVDVDASMLSHGYWDTGLDEGGAFSPYDLDGIPDEASGLSEFIPDEEANLLRQELRK